MQTNGTEECYWDEDRLFIGCLTASRSFGAVPVVIWAPFSATTDSPQRLLNNAAEYQVGYRYTWQNVQLYLASLSSGLSASLLNLHCSFLVLILSCCSDSVCRDLKAALLFLSYSLRLANLNKLHVLIQFWCAYMIPRISFFRRFWLPAKSISLSSPS